MKEIRFDERPGLPIEVADLWPSAPRMETGHSGRWIRFQHPAGGAVYLQRYSWDEPCVSHFLVVRCGDEGVVDQRRYASLGAAVTAVQAALSWPRQAEAPAAS